MEGFSTGLQEDKDKVQTKISDCNKLLPLGSEEPKGEVLMQLGLRCLVDIQRSNWPELLLPLHPALLETESEARELWLLPFCCLPFSTGKPRSQLAWGYSGRLPVGAAGRFLEWHGSEGSLQHPVHHHEKW